MAGSCLSRGNNIINELLTQNYHHRNLKSESSFCADSSCFVSLNHTKPNFSWFFFSSIILKEMFHDWNKYFSVVQEFKSILIPIKELRLKTLTMGQYLTDRRLKILKNILQSSSIFADKCKFCLCFDLFILFVIQLIQSGSSLKTT